MTEPSESQNDAQEQHPPYPRFTRRGLVAAAIATSAVGILSVILHRKTPETERVDDPAADASSDHAAKVTEHPLIYLSPNDHSEIRLDTGSAVIVQSEGHPVIPSMVNARFDVVSSNERVLEPIRHDPMKPAVPFFPPLQMAEGGPGMTHQIALQARSPGKVTVTATFAEAEEDAVPEVHKYTVTVMERKK